MPNRHPTRTPIATKRNPTRIQRASNQNQTRTQLDGQIHRPRREYGPCVGMEEEASVFLSMTLTTLAALYESFYVIHKYYVFFFLLFSLSLSLYVCTIYVSVYVYLQALAHRALTSPHTHPPSTGENMNIFIFHVRSKAHDRHTQRERETRRVWTRRRKRRRWWL